MLLHRGFLAAVLVALGFPPVGIWPLTIVGFVLFAFHSLELMNEGPDKHSDKQPPKTQRKKLFWHFFIYSFFVNTLGFYWIAYTFHEFGNIPWFVAILLAIIGFALTSLPSGLIGYLLAYLLTYLPKHLKKNTLLSWQKTLVFFVAIIIWDVIDIRVFPWTPAISVGSDTLLLASVYYLKTWGWRILFFGFCTLIAWNIQQLLLTQKNSLNKTNIKSIFEPNFKLIVGPILVPTICFFLFVYTVGFFAHKNLNDQHSDRQPIALLQGNVGNYEKKLTKLGIAPTIENVMNIHRDLVYRVAINYSQRIQNNDEIWMAWPETSFPGWPTSNTQSQKQLHEWTKLIGGLQLVGGYEAAKIDFGGKKKEVDYNIVALFHESKGLISHYRKRIRLAFGEYIPGDEYFPQLYDLLPAVNHFGKGEHFVPLLHPDPEGPIFLPLICYEILYESYVSDFIKEVQKNHPNRPLVIVNATNDSWYGPTSELFQHSLLARWVIANHGIPALRPTNTGLSQIISPWGEVLATAKRNESLVVFGELPVQRLQKRVADLQ